MKRRGRGACIFLAALGTALHNALVLSPNSVDSFALLVPILPRPMTGPQELRVNGCCMNLESTTRRQRHLRNTMRRPTVLEQVAKPVKLLGNSSGTTRGEAAFAKEKNYDHGRLVAFSLAVIYALASGTISPAMHGEVLELTLRHVAEASLPEDSTDVWCIVLGECVGALSSNFLKGLQTVPLSITWLVNARSIKATHILARVGAAAEAMAESGSINAAGSQSVHRGVRRDDKSSMIPRVFKEEPTLRDLNTIEIAGIDNESVLEITEIFADVIKWLQYDVITTAFDSGSMMPGVHALDKIEPAFIGLLSGLSALLYLDFVRLYTNYGPEKKQEEARTRSLAEWARLYAIECIATAGLFSAYEAAREPISALVVAH
jgi:hypothetical protein